MSIDFTKAPDIVGAKQVRRAVESGRAAKVLLAADADPRITEAVAGLCAEKGVETETVPAMKELGKACGISVGAAVAAVSR